MTLKAPRAEGGHTSFLDDSPVSMIGAMMSTHCQIPELPREPEKENFSTKLDTEEEG